ncbi:2-oxo acid dehydrogenase subunit E2, partial [Aduncisulcus paluster]
MFQVKFADIGEGIHEGVVFKIHVDTDGEVKEGESIMAIETDKVTADIPSPVSGKIVKMDWKPGDRIEVG